MLDAHPRHTPNLIEHLTAIGLVSHNIQLERGRSALYLDSGEPAFETEMRDQRRITDNAISDLKSLYAMRRQGGKTHLPSEAIVPHLFKKLDLLGTLRDHISKHKISFGDAVNAYTYQFSMPCIDAMLELSRLSEDTVPAAVSALNKFLQWKERTGRQRALGVHGFHTSKQEYAIFQERIRDLLAEQDSYFHTFIALADDEQKDIVNGFLENIEAEELGHLNELQDPKKGTSVRTWFQLMTRKINLMRETEIAILQTLIKSTQAVTDTPVAAPASPGHNRKPSRSVLRTVPIFKDMPDADLDKLLAQSSIRLYPRGKLLVQQGEPTMRAYVILNGWVKLYNSTPSGEESVLQMLSSGDTVLETSAILDSPSPFSAQVVEEATMVSLPAPLIRQNMRDSKEFSFSIANNISLRSQQLIHQIEQSRLSSAQERVGWFLLRLMLENNVGDRKISIPYEKSIAAAYLDMRPETFSRILKKFRQQGFDVQNDQIVVPHGDSLCQYCQHSTAIKCTRRNSQDCPLWAAAH